MAAIWSLGDLGPMLQRLGKFDKRASTIFIIEMHLVEEVEDISRKRTKKQPLLDRDRLAETFGFCPRKLQ